MDEEERPGGFDYDRASQHYDRFRRRGGPYMPALLRAAESCEARRVLEIGAGTGNVTGAFLDARPCSLTALEFSRGMIAKASAKDIGGRWVQGDGRRLPFDKAAFDFCFASMVLHHIDDLGALMAECVRVLDGGCCAFVTAPHGFIRRHPMNAYFPSFADIDLARFQSEDEIRSAMQRTGFEDISAELVVADPYPIDADFLAKVEGRFISTYDLMPEHEFREGVERLRRDIAASGSVGEMRWESLVISARLR